MAAVYSKIKADDYNIMQQKVSNVLGIGSGQSGWGQPVQSTPVTTSNAVTINEFNNLRYDIINSYVHLYNATPSVNSLFEGEKVRFNASNQPVSYWETLANDIVAKKNQLAVAGQRRTVNHGTASQTWPGTLGVNWSDGLYCIVTVEFLSGEDARKFFNSGSSIDFTSSRTSGAGTNQNASWTSLLSTAGTQQFGGNTPGTGTSPSDGTNFFKLQSTFGTPWFAFYASSPYALNFYRCSARCPDQPNNTSGTASKIEFKIDWVDDHFELGGDPADGQNPGTGTYGPDAVDGQLTLNVSTTEATGTLVPASAGSFSIATPNVVIGPILVA